MSYCKSSGKLSRGATQNSVRGRSPADGRWLVCVGVAGQGMLVFLNRKCDGRDENCTMDGQWRGRGSDGRTKSVLLPNGHFSGCETWDKAFCRTLQETNQRSNWPGAWAVILSVCSSKQ